jgi:outer membrane protein TolC
LPLLQARRALEAARMAESEAAGRAAMQRVGVYKSLGVDGTTDIGDR